MAQFIDSLADLTEVRDRDALEITVAAVLFQLILPLRLTLYRLVTDEAEPLLLMRADMREGQPVPISQPIWENADLPPLSSRPDLALAVVSHHAVRLSDTPAGHWCYAFGVASDTRPLGVMELELRRPLSRDHERLIGGVLRIYRNHLSMLEYSQHDALTGLMNRRTFEDQFERLRPGLDSLVQDEHLAGRRAEGGESNDSWLAAVDIDHFKQINDRFGHLYGDEVLIMLARIMRSTFRVTDRLYRFGGEEFLVLLNQTDAEGADAVLERLRARIEHFDFPQVGRVTASIGYTRVQPGDTPGLAFERADKALYYAKEHGRNQCTSFDRLHEAGTLDVPSSSNDAELF